MVVAPPEYGLLSRAAALSFQQGKHRESANLYATAFQATSPFGKWAPYRYHIFHGFTSILKERYFTPSQADFAFLEKVFKDKHEPKLYRCEAAFALALMNWDQGKREDAAAYYRDAIDLGENASGKERHMNYQKQCCSESHESYCWGPLGGGTDR